VTVYGKALFRDRNQTIKRTLFSLERRPDALRGVFQPLSAFQEEEGSKSNPTMNAIDNYIAKLYEKTADFYAKIQPDLATRGRDFKYRILYGPPFPNPPILWIGYQPGGRKPDTGEQYVSSLIGSQ
jgi:hypothetical protein